MSESSEEAAAQTRLGVGGGRANTRRTSRTSSSSSSSSSTTSNSPEKANENDDGLLGVIGARCSYDLEYVDYEDELGESQGPSPPTDHKSHADTTTAQSIIKQEEKKPAAVKKRLSKCPSENNLRRALEKDEEESTESSRRKNLSDRFQRHNRDRNVYNFHNTQLVIQDNNQALAKDEQQARNDRANVKDDEKKADAEQQNKSDESLVIINVNETQIIDEATGNSNNPVNPSTHLTYSKNQSTTSSKTSHKAMKRFQSENNLYIKNMSVVYNNQTKDEKAGSPENHVNDNDKTKSCGLEIAKYNFSADEDPNKV